MKIETKKIQRTPLIITSIIVALLVAGAGIAYSMSYWPFVDSETNQTAVEESSEETGGTTDEQETDDVKGPVLSDEPTEPIGGGATLVITELTQADSQVLLRARLENTAADGRCIAYFSSDGGAIAKYAMVSDTNGELMCSLDASVLEFNYLGKWSVRLVYTTPDNKKIETTGELVIR